MTALFGVDLVAWVLAAAAVVAVAQHRDRVRAYIQAVRDGVNRVLDHAQ